ncbi:MULTISPECIES: hypothetical protein [unclassified Erwinia]|uniref:hypothetical protein n=1 Tax=unclassified Erwinia TaxID=2622719 RepID=UPI000C188EDB|nr:MULTISPECIES: hypothetical protein [unclassified Erwinia]PIJ48497.1 hypothetical protein BV501_16830 [Erwinia sp. OAMSP11]PIJ78769.1 hypothetical protein BLD47_16770 [Erwinia sp. OLCASP19]PIJ80114.1 hypothetical protein BLD46_16020 [Erwinia sp. OLMTSP26]PIJ82183.1 hypothetical protein BLD49_15695 [Erwinia sp. OLMDSP33]PIJ88970.1 hypothetical protein BL249_17565 [Erwinia sp. OLFS4]
MTDLKNTLSVDVYDSFCTLRKSVDALLCAADLIPEGGDDESLGHLFRLLSSRIETDLNVYFQTFCLSRS